MKSFYYRITQADLTESEGYWHTGPIDLYENDVYTNYSVTKSTYVYTNYSVTKSTYGVGQERMWIGLADSNGTVLTKADIDNAVDLETNTGRVESGRYIDRSGRIDIRRFYSLGSQQPSLRIKNADVSDLSDVPFNPDPDKDAFKLEDNQLLIDASVYADFLFEDAPETDFEVLIEVQIDKPVMAPIYRSTRSMLNDYPGWMALRDQAPDDREPATPVGIGGSYLNAISGEMLDELASELKYRDFQRYISLVDLGQKAWTWLSNSIPEHIYSIEGDGVPLARMHDRQELLKQEDGEDAVFIDDSEGELFCLQQYTSLIINGEEYNQFPHHEWNYLDELGALVDLDRLHLEGNINYQKRILDTFKNRGGVGIEQFKLALRRELDMWRYEGATPDSDYEGATPEVLEMSDIERDDKYFLSNGLATKAFKQFIESLSHEYPTTWGRFQWGETIWDAGGRDGAGYGVIPNEYDVDLLPADQLKSGVGDANDLFVYRPDTFTGPRDYNATLKMRGRRRTFRDEYRPVTVELEVYGTGDRDYYDQPKKTVWYTVEIETADATPQTLIHSFRLEATSDVNNANAEATPESWTTYNIFSEQQLTTSEEIDFVYPDTNVPYEGDGTVPLDNIQSVKLVQGRWIADSYQNLENENHFEAWFSHDETDVLTVNTTSGSEPSFGYTADATPYLPFASVVMKSLDTEPPTAGTWNSDRYTFEVVVNDLEPYTDEQPVVIDIPEIQWDPYVTNRSLGVEIVSTNPFDAIDIEYGGTTTDQKGDSYFIPASDIVISVDGVPLTVTDGQTSTLDSTEAIEIAVPSGTAHSSIDSISYPIQSEVWTLFEALHDTPFAGIVDENGPWRDGVPPYPGNTNYTAKLYDSLSRDDFAVPNTDNYRVTWIGVENDNNRVVAWLDSNTVEPVIKDDETEYPESAVTESLVNGVYVYEPIILRARVKPGVDPQWYPQVNSGYFYEEQEEYYFYAKKGEETTATDELILSEVARQGAPIIARTDEAEPVYMRQVSFFDDSATPSTLSHINKEIIKGNDTDTLYLGYTDIYDVTVTDSDGADVGVTDVVDNTVTLDQIAPYDTEYTVSYSVNNSFYVDNQHILANGNQASRVVFDSPPPVGVNYVVTFEKSEFDPATPVDVPLNPLYTVQTEGFLYISFDEYNLNSIRTHLSPQRVLADGVDYIVITMTSEDEHGNPKPNQAFTLSTNFGTLTETDIVTDQDGFAVSILESSDVYPGSTGSLTISGDINDTIEFEIEEAKKPKPTIVAVVGNHSIQADGESLNRVHGKVRHANFTPVEGATVNWRRARTIYDLFEGDVFDSGSVTTDENGVFEIGPIVSQTTDASGYWFTSVETVVAGDEATPIDHIIGDVVFWHEFPDITSGVENENGLPIQSVQITDIDASAIPEYRSGVKHPYEYNEESTGIPEDTVEINWTPPEWYAVSAYKQWVLGMNTNETYKSV